MGVIIIISKINSITARNILQKALLMVGVLIVVVVVNISLVYAAPMTLFTTIPAFFISVSTVAALTAMGVGAFYIKFSLGKDSRIFTGRKIIINAIVAWVLINGVIQIINYVVPNRDTLSAVPELEVTIDRKVYVTTTPFPTPLPVPDWYAVLYQNNAFHENGMYKQFTSLGDHIGWGFGVTGIKVWQPGYEVLAYKDGTDDQLIPFRFEGDYKNIGYAFPRMNDKINHIKIQKKPHDRKDWYARLFIDTGYANDNDDAYYRDLDNRPYMNIMIPGKFKVGYYGFEDNISSLKILSGYKAIIYDGDHYTNPFPQYLKGDYPNLSEVVIGGRPLNNQINAIEIMEDDGLPPTDYVVLYKEPNFQTGLRVQILGPFNPVHFYFRNSISSLKVKEGYKIIAYDDNDFKEPFPKYIRGNHADLSKFEFTRNIYINSTNYVATYNLDDKINRIKVLEDEIDFLEDSTENLYRHGFLKPGQSMKSYDYKTGISGKFQLNYTTTGELYIQEGTSGPKYYIFNEPTANPGLCRLALTTGLVIYDANWNVRWDSGSPGSEVLRIEHNGVAVIYDKDRQVLWAKGPPGAKVPNRSIEDAEDGYNSVEDFPSEMASFLLENHMLRNTNLIKSDNGLFRARLIDGDFRLEFNTSVISASKRIYKDTDDENKSPLYGWLKLKELGTEAVYRYPLPEETGWQTYWHTDTHAVNGYMIMQNDGDLVIRDATGKIIWATGISEAKGAAIMDDGNFVLGEKDMQIIAETNTKFDAPIPVEPTLTPTPTLPPRPTQIPFNWKMW